MDDTATRITGGCLCGALRHDAVCNVCAVRGRPVFGGQVGKDASFTFYAGSLDDPSTFRPTIAIFAGSRPSWAVLPLGLKVLDGLPG